MDLYEGQNTSIFDLCKILKEMESRSPTSTKCTDALLMPPPLTALSPASLKSTRQTIGTQRTPLTADPKPKSAKMDNPSGSPSSTRPVGCRNRPKRTLIDPEAHSFDVIRNILTFVDHTHFIHSFLKHERNLAIFAPRRFGKTSHLSMVEKFLEIDVDKITGEVPPTVNYPAKDRKNYKLFAGTRIITDDTHKLIVESHLGKHPVIHLDFKRATIHCVEDARMHCRLAVHNAYRKHPYLKTSAKLDPGCRHRNAVRQEIYERWCCEERYKTQNLENSLVNLISFLYNHFNSAKVYVLVDEIDAINSSALSRVRGSSHGDTVKKHEHICEMLADLIGPVTKGKHVHVAGALITGASYLSSSGIFLYSLMDNFTKMRFLDSAKTLGTDFVSFYGATKEEVRSLIQKLARDKVLVQFEGRKEFLNNALELDVDKIMAAVQSCYNGYFDRNGTQIFNLCSVLQYLESGKAKNYWSKSNGIEKFFMILKSEKVALAILKLMRWEVLRFELNKLFIEHLVKLHDLMIVNSEDRADPQDVFTFLMDQGYLSYPEGGSQCEKFKLPNVEIRTALSVMIGDIVKSYWRISTTSCSSLIKDITLGLMKNDELLQNKMLLVYEAISEMLRPLKQSKRTLMNEARILCIMYKMLDDANLFVLVGNVQIKDSKGRAIPLDISDFLLLRKDDRRCSVLWELRCDKYSAKNENTTSLYALQEARGIVPTRYGATKNSLSSLKSIGREALVIGLSIDSDFNVSLSYSVGMENKIFAISKMEPTLYPILYKTHNPELLLEKHSDVEGPKTEILETGN